MKPNLLIIGAHKCGTTALHEYLSLHPQVFMSRTKELHFFVEEVNWSRGLDWYQAYFPEGSIGPEVKVVGESSPSYTNYPRYPGVPARAHSIVPEAKLILMVRDPIDRILSHYRMERARGEGRRSLQETLLRHFRNPYIWQSMYWMQVRQFLDYYPMSRIMIATQEELLRDRRAVLRRAFSFLGVSEDFTHPEFESLRNTSDEREVSAFGEPAPPPVMTEIERQRLIDHLAPDIEQFRRHTGHRFSEWSL